MAQDFAEVAMEIYRLQDADGPAQEQVVERLKADGAPTALPELVDMAASTVIKHNMGWYRRNQFFGGLQGFCVLMGMPKAEAAYLRRLIQAQVRQGSAR
jgi:hypothetical protein